MQPNATSSPTWPHRGFNIAAMPVGASDVDGRDAMVMPNASHWGLHPTDHRTRQAGDCLGGRKWGHSVHTVTRP